MIVIFIAIACSLPVLAILCDPTHWGLIVYNYFQKYKVQKAQEKIKLSHYKTVFLDDDESGAFMTLDGYKFYLKAMKAKPLKGLLIGENYYTINQEDAYVEVCSDGF